MDKLPKIPNIDSGNWPVGMQADDWWRYWELDSEAVRARLRKLARVLEDVLDERTGLEATDDPAIEGYALLAQLRDEGLVE